jgi:hypothetical protein
MVVLAFASVWDVFTTVYGTIAVLGDGPFQIIAALLFAGLVLGFVLNTGRVFRWGGGLVGGLVKFFWFIALFYDLYTSWIANAELLVGGSGDAAEIVILIGLTVLVVSSPILLSAAWQKRRASSQEASA